MEGFHSHQKAESQGLHPLDVEGNADPWAECQGPLIKVRGHKHGATDQARSEWEPKEDVNRRWSMKESPEWRKDKHSPF